MTGAALERFVLAQDESGTFDRALGELRSGAKRSHWMWFVFPQLAGLGSSPTAVHFALGSLADASSYLDHPVLGPRLRLATTAILTVPDRTATEILGPVDALKLRSSMTLFGRADPHEPLFPAVLDRYFDGTEDARTLALLGTPD